MNPDSETKEKQTARNQKGGGAPLREAFNRAGLTALHEIGVV